ESGQAHGEGMVGHGGSPACAEMFRCDHDGAPVRTRQSAGRHHPPSRRGVHAVVPDAAPVWEEIAVRIERADPAIIALEFDAEAPIAIRAGLTPPDRADVAAVTDAGEPVRAVLCPRRAGRVGAAACAGGATAVAVEVDVDIVAAVAVCRARRTDGAA